MFAFENFCSYGFFRIDWFDNRRNLKYAMETCSTCGRKKYVQTAFVKNNLLFVDLRARIEQTVLFPLLCMKKNTRLKQSLYFEQKTKWNSTSKIVVSCANIPGRWTIPYWVMQRLITVVKYPVAKNQNYTMFLLLCLKYIFNKCVLATIFDLETAFEFKRGRTSFCATFLLFERKQFGWPMAAGKQKNLEVFHFFSNNFCVFESHEFHLCVVVEIWMVIIHWPWRLHLHILNMSLLGCQVLEESQ